MGTELLANETDSLHDEHQAHILELDHCMFHCICVSDSFRDCVGDAVFVK